MNHLGTKTLETERLILRKTLETDYKPMFRNWANDERVTRYLTWPPYESAEQLKTTYHRYLLDSQEKADFYDWKIVWKETGEPIGSIGAVSLRENISEVEIGYCLGFAWWHKGIMTEAFSRVIRFLFDEVGVNRITATHDPRNPHSGDVMKKCGLQYEGTSRQAGRNMQGICDVARYAILKEDYGKDDSMKHAMKLHPEPFSMIRSGQKTIELRLNDEKRRDIKVGDRIEFTQTETGEKLSAEVVRLHRFDSFAELYRALPLLKCGYTDRDIADAKPEDMELYYSPAQQAKYGVLGIEIKTLAI